MVIPMLSITNSSRETVTLRGWLVNPGLVREKLLIYYGGNGEDIFHNIEEFRDIKAASLFVAYRGYGPSDGRPGEAELFADALAVIDDMQQQICTQTDFSDRQKPGLRGWPAMLRRKEMVQGLSW